MDTPLYNRLVAVAALLLAAAALLSGMTPVLAQTTPCEAIFEPVLAAGLSQANLHLRRQWAMIDGHWVSAYRLEGEKPNPFDPARLGQMPARRAADGTPDGAAAKPLAPPRLPPAAPLPAITGFASARDVRCNASAASAKADVMLVYSAAGVRFQEGRGPWSPVVRDAALAVIQLRRSGSGWILMDRTAERGAMPPDAQRSPPHDTLAHELATIPWLPPRSRRTSRRR